MIGKSENQGALRGYLKYREAKKLMKTVKKIGCLWRAQIIDDGGYNSPRIEIERDSLFLDNKDVTEVLSKLVELNVSFHAFYDKGNSGEKRISIRCDVK